jgi:hypothetical protein
MSDFPKLKEWEITGSLTSYRLGDESKRTPEMLRKLVAVNLLQRACGFAIGGTMRGCLIEMRLLGAKTGNLTKRGKMALWDLMEAKS